MNERAEPSLVKDPVPKGLVIVRTLDETEQLALVEIPPLTDDRAQVPEVKVIPEGKVMTISELVGIA